MFLTIKLCIYAKLNCLKASSSYRVAGTDIPDPLSPLLPIIHRLWQVFWATSRIFTQLLYVRAGSPAFARPYVEIHRSTSLMSSSLFLQQCPAYLVRLTWIVFVMGGRQPYSWCLVGCCCQDLLTAFLCNCYLASFSSRLVSVQVVHPYSSIDTTTAWKRLRFILSVRSDFHMIGSLWIAVHAFVSRVSMSFSVDSTLLPRQVNLSTSFRGVPSSVVMSPV